MYMYIYIYIYICVRRARTPQTYCGDVVPVQPIRSVDKMSAFKHISISIYLSISLSLSLYIYIYIYMYTTCYF